MKTIPLPGSPALDGGLLWLRVSGSALLLYVHGWPKLAHYGAQLAQIEDPFGFGAPFSMLAAIVAEALCPLLTAAGLYTRPASLPVIGVLAVAMLAVHRRWTIAEGQFGWLLMIVFVAVALCGPGRWSLDAVIAARRKTPVQA